MLFSLFIYINAQKVEILHGMTKYFAKSTQTQFLIKKNLHKSKTVMLPWRIGQRFITVVVILDGKGIVQA